MQLGCWRCPSGCGFLEGSLWQEGGSEELWGAHGEEGEGSGDSPSGEFPLVDLKLFSLEKTPDTGFLKAGKRRAGQSLVSPAPVYHSTMNFSLLCWSRAQ